MPTYTYSIDSGPPFSALNQVRLILADTNVDKAIFSDEEIGQFLHDTDNEPYCAAARAATTLLFKFGYSGRGTNEKKVGYTTVKYGLGEFSIRAMLELAAQLRKECARIRRGSASLLKVVVSDYDSSAH